MLGDWSKDVVPKGNKMKSVNLREIDMGPGNMQLKKREDTEQVRFGHNG